MPKQYSYPKSKIKILLTERIHDAAREYLEQSGYSVTSLPDALEGEELAKQIADVHVLGVRSRTKIRAEHLAQAQRLLVVGCFSVGTDQVDLNDAAKNGVAVFNAPHSSTRSVAELTLANVVMLARRAAHKSNKLHSGIWDKSLANAVEVRGKTLGIIGYGHIGQQVGLLAEAFGMEVLFHDVTKKLALGRARPAPSLESILSSSQFVTLHIPGSPENKHFIGKEQFTKMRKGSCFLNLSRGNVVDLEALSDVLKSEHLAGAALDVFPVEPSATVGAFEVPLKGLDNVILTPHIGGSTEEAQQNIGLEVARSIEAFIDAGTTVGAVNFPAVNLPSFPGSHRILNIHKNVPGVLAAVNSIISELGANINAQYLNTFQDVGYLIMDISQDLSEEVKQRITALPMNIKTRILY
jgi:D-3-phosphoglycerate dehydrogenase